MNEKKLSLFEKVIYGDLNITEDEVILEGKVADTADECEQRLGRMVEHLYKIAYCDSDTDYSRDRRHWLNEIIEAQGEVIKIIRWDIYTGGWKSVVNKISLENVSSNAIRFYESSARKNKSLVDGISFLPKKLCWTLEELLENAPTKLLSKIPYRRKSTV